MVKRVFSLLFATAIFLSAAAPAAADFKNLASAATGISAAADIIENDVHFVKNYSKVITDVCKNFVYDIISFSELTGSCSIPLSIRNAVKMSNITDAILVSGNSEKKNVLYGTFADSSLVNDQENAGALLFVFVIMFILWYIGLLRLFSGASFFTKQIKI